LLIYRFDHLTLALSMILLGVGIAVAQLLGQWSSLMAVPEQAKALANGLYNSARSAGSLSGNALAALVLGSFTAIGADAGVAVLKWQLLLFVLPLVLVLLSRR
jgi:sugar phosphate permease